MSESVITTFQGCLMFVTFPPKKPCVVQCCLRLPSDPCALIRGDISLQWHEVLLFLQSWFLGAAIEATRGLKGCRADWEMGHVICPWNILWHNMTPGHLYVKVNISAWQLDKSGKGSRQCGFILVSEKEALWLCVAPECVDVCAELLFPNLIPIDIVSWSGLKRRCLAPSFKSFFFFCKRRRGILWRALEKKNNFKKWRDDMMMMVCWSSY